MLIACDRCKTSVLGNVVRSRTLIMIATGKTNDAGSVSIARPRSRFGRLDCSDGHDP
jgi:hypothetical protein